jgi:hypothetical protein
MSGASHGQIRTTVNFANQMQIILELGVGISTATLDKVLGYCFCPSRIVETERSGGDEVSVGLHCGGGFARDLLELTDAVRLLGVRDRDMSLAAVIDPVL